MKHFFFLLTITFGIIKGQSTYTTLLTTFLSTTSTLVTNRVAIPVASPTSIIQSGILAPITANTFSLAPAYLDLQAALNQTLAAFRANLNRVVPNSSVSVVNGLISDIATAAEDSSALSTFLNTYLVGRQKPSFSYAVYKNYTGVLDDNPKDITQIRASYSVPIFHKSGFLLRDNGLKVVWCRSVLFTADLTPFGKNNTNFYATDTLIDSEHPDSLKSANRRRYYNTMDLFQFSRFNFYTHVNVFTIVNKYYTVYSGVYASWGRTWFNSRRDTTTKINFWMYGLKLSAKTKFEVPINCGVDLRLFTVNPLANGLSNRLNAQYADIKSTTDRQAIVSNDQKWYFAFNFTPQLRLSKTSNNTYTPSSSVTSSNADAILFFRLNFNTMLNSMWDKKLNRNNFYIIQIGYQGSLDKLIENVSNFLGGP